MPSTIVPVGVTSVAGYSVSLVSAVMAVVAYLSGDRSQETVGTIVAGAVAALAFVSTQLGRYAQAHAQVKANAVPEAETPVVEGPPPLNAIPEPAG